MTPEQRLMGQMRAQRTHWLELAPGKSVAVLRPLEAEQVGFLQKGEAGFSLVAELTHAQKFVCDWKGFVEADLVGPSGASDIATAFTPDLWAELCADRADYARAVAQKLVDLIVEHRQAREAAAKN